MKKTSLCENCGKKPMQVSYTYIHNGERADYNLCFSCAQKLHMEERFSQFLNQVMAEEFMDHFENAFEKGQLKIGDVTAYSEPVNPFGAEPKLAEGAQPQKVPTPKIPPKIIPSLDVLDSKILALQMDKEAAIAAENYQEAGRIQKMLEGLYKEREGK